MVGGESGGGVGTDNSTELPPQKYAGFVGLSTNEFARIVFVDEYPV